MQRCGQSRQVRCKDNCALGDAGGSIGSPLAAPRKCLQCAIMWGLKAGAHWDMWWWGVFSTLGGCYGMLPANVRNTQIMQSLKAGVQWDGIRVFPPCAGCHACFVCTVRCVFYVLYFWRVLCMLNNRSYLPFWTLQCMPVCGYEVHACVGVFVCGHGGQWAW
eukprot:287043-Pelagomonas_calceolata.AAC.5